MEKITIHLVSDSSGQTASIVARAAVAQFPGLEIKEYHWVMVRDHESLDQAKEKIKEKGGIVLYTMSDKKMRQEIERFCKAYDIICIYAIGGVVEEISKMLGISAKREINYTGKFDESYFSRLEAIDYTIKHDDGLGVQDINNADIIIVGQSRTSKTPTSIYLSYNGFKTINIPYVQGIDLPKELFLQHNALIVGLVIHPVRLMEIRESRMDMMNMYESTSYTNFEALVEECNSFKRICKDNNWNMIEVSRKSIEEIAGAIMKLYYEQKTGK